MIGCPRGFIMPVNAQEDIDRRADGGRTLRENDAGGEECRSEECSGEAVGESEEEGGREEESGVTWTKN